MGMQLGLSRMLKTDPFKGLKIQDNEQLFRHKEVFGSNEFENDELTPFYKLILNCFEDMMLQILLVAALVSLVIGVWQKGIEEGWMEGSTIIIAILLICMITSINEYKKERQFQQLQQSSKVSKLKIMRNNQTVYIDYQEIVVGDVLCVNIGDILIIDGILLTSDNLSTDESSFTGESDLIMKSLDKDPFIVSGSKVLDGQGTVLVCSVGGNTVDSQIKAILEKDNEPTPLQTKLESIADDIGKIGMFFASITVIALMVNYVLEGKPIFSIKGLEMFTNSLIIGVTIIVVAVPEGLPLAVVIALAYSVNKMKEKNNLVKKMESCETMGGVDIVCCDKTGTLTQNIMQVEQIYANDQNYIPNQPLQNIQQWGELVSINSSADLIINSNGHVDKKGNKTECALLEYITNFGLDYKVFRRNQKVIKTLPFNSITKIMATFYQNQQAEVKVSVKGATEQIIARCGRICINGQVVILDNHMKDKLNEVVNVYAKNTLRTIAMAYNVVSNEHVSRINNQDMQYNYLNNLVFLGIAGIKDPLRTDVANTVQQFKQAGMRVVMVTGDNVKTARAIAQEAGILTQEEMIQQYSVIQGPEFRSMVGGLVQNADKEYQIKNIDVFQKIVQNLRVIGRSTPEDKYILVTGLKQCQHVVAVTGDGTNDAPALNKANVGIAMGIVGTEVAKDAAGIILLDDNFNSIIIATKYGRNIYDSIRKFIQFQLTINFVALVIAFIGSVVLSSSPLNSIQMLWVNLIMDTFAALALATDPPKQCLLDRKPQPKYQNIVSLAMWRNISVQFVYQMTILIFVLFYVPSYFGIPNTAKHVNDRQYKPENFVHYTIFFQTFVMMQLINEFNSRKIQPDELNVFKDLFDNPLFWFVMIISFVVQYLLVQFGGAYVKLAPLSVEQHLICLGFGLGSLVVCFIGKLIVPLKIFKCITLFQVNLPDYLKVEDRDQIEMINQKMKYSSPGMLRKSTTIRIGHIHSKAEIQAQNAKRIQSMTHIKPKLSSRN